MGVKEWIQISGWYDFLGKRSFSQCGEDLVAASYLGKERGIYIDVGAYHPKVFSNTYYFYKRGWSGVVVEPNARMGELFASSRPRDTVVRAGVGEAPDVGEYFVFEDEACNTFDVAKVEEYKKVGRVLVKKEAVEILPLEKIVAASKVKRIDLLSVDVEGMDLAVLKSLDWERWHPRVVIVEDMEFDLVKPERSEVVKFMNKQKYELKSVLPYSLVFVLSEEKQKPAP